MGATIEDGDLIRRTHASPVPGVALVFVDGRPASRAIPLESGVIVLGREAGIEDGRVSRRHVEIEYRNGTWIIRDQGSRNGTFVDGKRITNQVEYEGAPLVRFGQSLALCAHDLRQFLQDGVISTSTYVAGPELMTAWRAIETAARAGGGVLITGETGTGKELAAQRFHKASGSSGPFIAVNCAAIPEGVAERLLFGARKGAYSGATDADGYFVAAHGGTLFLDELGELDLNVQAKLLRALENREIIPVGATRPIPVDVRVVTATTRDVAAAVGDKTFREDLYYRIGRPEVRLPPLRERREEIPHLVDRMLDSVDSSPTADVAFVEAAMIRAWPGNVRELVGAVRRAGYAAVAEQRGMVMADDLEPDAGVPLPGQPDPSASGRLRAGTSTDDQAVLAALREARGNVSRAARSLGWHRTQLRRWIEKHGIDPKSFAQ